jgi:hypothetical protein
VCIGKDMRVAIMVGVSIIATAPGQNCRSIRTGPQTLNTTTMCATKSAIRDALPSAMLHAQIQPILTSGRKR